MRLLGLVLYCSLAMSSFVNAKDEEIILALRCVERSTAVEKFVFVATGPKAKLVEVASHEVCRLNAIRRYFFNREMLRITESYTDGDGGSYVTITDDVIVYGRRFFSLHNREYIASNNIDRHTGIWNTYGGQSYDCSPTKIVF
jgi:hypothetical protein